jgi:hypothetical protein
MRIILQSISCEWCETPFDLDDLTEEDDVDEAMQAVGWLYVHREGKDLDFCSDGCCIRHLE